MRLMSIEGHFSENCFSQIFSLTPYLLRPDYRKTFKAYDGINNVFNPGYELLAWRIQYSIAKGKRSLVCDFQELYRYLIDDFIVEYCRDLHKQDFTAKTARARAIENVNIMA
jgi:CRISPR/Cas system-associated endonuclease Cas1